MDQALIDVYKVLLQEAADAAMKITSYFSPPKKRRLSSLLSKSLDIINQQEDELSTASDTIVDLQAQLDACLNP